MSPLRIAAFGGDTQGRQGIWGPLVSQQTTAPAGQAGTVAEETYV